jgi:glycosyltransferase involved in cell wall biosynthesis
MLIDGNKSMTIIYLSTFPPRECGIGTFTKDLTDAMDKRFFPLIKSKIAALNEDPASFYNYERKVITSISDNDIIAYIELAKKINFMEDVKLVDIQHEFGIFGGNHGDSILAFLETIKKPVVITFHTIIPKPDKSLRKIVRSIAERVSEIIVITKKGVEILQNDYGVKTKITVIPHGIPIVKFEPQKKEKLAAGYGEKLILSSFGLISSNKGYEHVINSLPKVVAKFPNLLYLIIGKTHPMVEKKEGMTYINSLSKRVKELNLQNNVKFYTRFVTLNEIIKYLKMTDIYISSSTTKNQISSGTLSYALGTGRVVISTPFIYAKDIITPKVGVLTEFNDPNSFSKAIIQILSNERLRKDMEYNAYSYTRHMIWPNVALAYGKVFKTYLNLPEAFFRKLPNIKTKHLEELTDEFGIIQFSKGSNPDIESGYTLDDNARALIVFGSLYNDFKKIKYLKLLRTYLDFIEYVQDRKGLLWNYVNKNRKINFKDFSSDAHGRAIWALGQLISMEGTPEEIKEKAESIFLNALKNTDSFKSPRSIAFTIIGLYYYNNYKQTIAGRNILKKLSKKLLDAYYSNSSREWNWFEDSLTYANSKLPEALFYSYIALGRESYKKAAKESMDFLISKTFSETMFSPVGQKGWFSKGKKKPLFDQQPIEASYTIQALLAAYKATGEKKYEEYALHAFQWFLGKNSARQTICDEKTGACYDGITRNGVNLNEGAESALSYMLARLAITKF